MLELHCSLRDCENKQQQLVRQFVNGHCLTKFLNCPSTVMADIHVWWSCLDYLHLKLVFLHRWLSKLE